MKTKALSTFTAWCPFCGEPKLLTEDFCKSCSKKTLADIVIESMQKKLKEKKGEKFIFDDDEDLCVKIIEFDDDNILDRFPCIYLLNELEKEQS